MANASLVQKTVLVLRAVAASGDGIGLSEVSRAAGIPKATCLRILAVLGAERIVLLEQDSKRYYMAFGALTIVGDLLNNDSPYLHVQHVLRELVASTGETGGLDVLVDTDVIVVAQVQSPRVIGYAPKPVPRSLPTWSTSTGKVLLADVSEGELRMHHAKALRSARGARRASDDFVKELADVRRRGYGTARDELEPGAAAVAAPVTVDGVVVAAAWIGGPTFRITPERVPALAGEVMKAAASIGEIMALSGGRVSGRPGDDIHRFTDAGTRRR